MSVILETSVGDIVIDLFCDKAPKTCENFLKLCKLKYYNFSPIHTVRKNALFQTGDPVGPHSKDSDGGCSIWGILDGGATSPRRAFEPEYHKSLKHADMGTVSMATAPSPADPDTREAASQFLITLGNGQHYLDKDAAIFGHVAEGFDVLEKINDTTFVDADQRPLKDIRILHTVVIDEADIPDPPGFAAPPSSPLPTPAQLANQRIPHDEDLSTELSPEEVDKLRREREARQQALTLEMVGDLPFAEVAPPENVLFVCKLNPVTRDEDLELIFSRFGRVLSCEVIRDKRTGDSLQYAFVEFAQREECERAYFKMQSVLIDDHRIHVDFSQSVSRLADVWRNKASRKRATGGEGGGFGGIEGLERKKQFKADWEEDRRERHRRDGDGGYGMVFDGDREGRRRRRSRSPQVHRPHPQDGRRGRSPGDRYHSSRDERRRSGSRDRDHRRRDDRHRDDRRRG